jgi:hypothetical protein
MASNLMDKLNDIGLVTLDDFKNISEEYLIGKIPCSPLECRKIYRRIIDILKPQTKIIVGGNNKYGKLGLGDNNINIKQNEYTEIDISENIIDVDTSDTQTILLNNNGEIYRFGHNGKHKYITYETNILPFMNLLNPNKDIFKSQTLKDIYNYELYTFRDDTINYSIIDNETIEINCIESNRTGQEWLDYESISQGEPGINRSLYFPIYFQDINYNNDYINNRRYKINIEKIDIHFLTQLSGIIDISGQGSPTMVIKFSIEKVYQRKGIILDIENISNNDNYNVVETITEYSYDLGDITSDGEYNVNFFSVTGIVLDSNLTFNETSDIIEYNRIKIQFICPLTRFDFNKKIRINLELYESNFNIKNDVLSDYKYELNVIDENFISLPTKIPSLKQYNRYTFLSGIKKISAGYNHLLLLDNKKYIYSYGSNLYGELGDGKSTYMIDFNIDTYYQNSIEPLFTNVPSTIFGTIVFDYNESTFKNVHVENIHNENIYISSDRRIKKNITDVSDAFALDTIRKIETKEYEYIDKELKGYKKAIGFIAQDVQKYFPQAVKIGENNVLTYVELKKYTWKDVDNFYELNIFKKDIPYKIYAFYTLYNNKLQSVDYINNIEYPEFNNYTFKTKYDVMYIGVYKTINDFHFLQKNKLFTLHHSGLQELYKKHNDFNEKIIKLKERLQKIPN